MAQGDRVLVVGAGLAGSLVACLLAQRGYRVEVFERRPDPRVKGFIGGRSINLALSVRGIHALEHAGVADRVLAEAIAMPGRMIHSQEGRLTFQPYSKDPGEAINSVSRGGLNIILLEAAAAHDNVCLQFEHCCVDVDLDHARVTFEVGEDGGTRTAEADWVIGADGAFSAVRGCMQIQERFDYSQNSLRHGYKELTVPPNASDDFAMEAHALHIWPRGGSMMIALPNRDRSFTCTLFWPFHGPNSFEEVQGAETIRAFFKKRYPDAVSLMPTLVEDYETNLTGSLVTIRCAPWHWRDRVVLVGDAAHAIVPFFGQGMNAAFEDCVLLMERLEEHRSERARALETFFQNRKPDADAIADLALDNFIEMRDRVASPLFRLRKRIERVLHRLLPRWYTPRYNMVSFTRIPYAEAQRRGRHADRVLTTACWLVLVLFMLVVLGILWGMLAP
jgi:kynurenine 3-monooxygenase